jgi:hypothetical protein
MTVMDMKKKNDKQKGCCLLVDASQVFGISDRNRIINTREIFKIRSNLGKR